MPINADDWPERFGLNEIPALPCPRCGKGRMNAKKPKEGLEPAYSINEHSHDAWEPSWVTERYVLEFRCGEAKCGEVSVMVCDAAAVEALDEEHGWIYETQLTPKYVFPAPHLFQIPENVPKSISEPLIDAFTHYWGDEASSANKLRVSVEALMDHWAIPKLVQGKNKKAWQLSLQGRIELAAKNGFGEKDALEAVKWVGNVGSHDAGHKFSKKALVEVMEVYEDIIKEEFVNKSHKAKLKVAVKKIISKKGKI